MSDERCWDASVLDRQKRLVSLLARLAKNPPRSLILEAGTAKEREELGFYWAAVLNCSRPETGAPCLVCPVCTRIRAGVFRDLEFVDGGLGMIGIDEARRLRAVLSDHPHGSGVRTIVIAQAQEMTPEAANALLKSLEEPLPGNVFTLLVPERGALLPTLVSRSQILTLSRDMNREQVRNEAVDEWMESLARFAESGRGLFVRTGSKGALDKNTVLDIVGSLQHMCLTALQGGKAQGSMGVMLAGMPGPAVFECNHMLLQAVEDLRLNVGPALVLDSLALWLWRARQALDPATS
jgi:DNA polymerase-3 subunit delta'